MNSTNNYFLELAENWTISFDNYQHALLSEDKVAIENWTAELNRIKEITLEYINSVKEL